MQISICSERPLITPNGLERFDYQLDTYIGCGHYCYYCYALRQAETDWNREVQIHRNIEKQLENELSSIIPQPIYIGYHSDPYQPCESEYKQTRATLEVLLANAFSAGILTKSDLVLRDLDILTEMKNASVSVSVAIKDDRTRKLFEANTIETQRRIEALQKVKQAGIRTGALLCPVIPYVTEVLDLLEALTTCADTIWVYGLSADSDEHIDIGWKNTREILATYFPGIAVQTQSAVFSKNHPFWMQLKDDIETIHRSRNLDLRVYI